MPVKEQKFTKTPFKKQADVISGVLRTNPILNDDEKKSLQETVGVLTWLNQLQLHWAGGNEGLPESIRLQIFEGRKPEKVVPPGT
jgi:hypothetical protein